MRGARGRRPGGPDTREEILEGARSLFAENGFAATSLRAVAARAGVDPALVHHYFAGKEDLFLASLRVGDLDPREELRPVAAGGPEGAGERLVRTLLAVWDDPVKRVPLLGLARGLLDPAGPQLAREAIFALIFAPLGEALGIDRPERRMTLVASQAVGIVILRYVVEAPSMVALTTEEMVAAYAPTLQRYLTGPLP